MEKDYFKIESIRSEVSFKFEPTPHIEMKYLKFAVHYMTSDGIRMQYFTESVYYVNGEPRIERAKNKSLILYDQKPRLDYLARHSCYTTDELYSTIINKLDCILLGGDNKPVSPHAIGGV